MEISLPAESASNDFAKKLAQLLVRPPIVITFSGEIGAGKTTIIRELLRQLGVTGTIKSPTYSLVETYETDFPLHHFDLYRIQNEEELDYLGFREYFDTNAIILIEWPERAKHSLPLVDLVIKLALQNEGRLLQIDALTEKGNGILTELDGLL